MADTRQSRPDLGRGIQAEVLQIFEVVSSALGSGKWGRRKDLFLGLAHRLLKNGDQGLWGWVSSV